MNYSQCISALLVAGGLALGSPAFAQSQYFIGGNVYQVTSNGVYVQNTNGVTFVPAANSTFRINNRVVRFNRLRVGTPVNAYYGSNYQYHFVPQEYYQQNRNRNWDLNVNGWRQDRKNWRNQNGRWQRNQ